MPGEIYALFGAMLFGSGHIAVRRAHDDGWGNHTVLLVLTIVNVVCFLAGLSYQVLAGLLPAVRAEAIGFFAAAGFFTVLLGRTALFSSIERIGAARAASFRVTSPIVTVAMAYVLLSERLTLGAFVGAGVVLVGVWLLTGETSKQGTARPTADRPERVVLIGILLGMASSFFFGTGQVFRKLGLDFTSAPLLGAAVGSGLALLMIGSAALRGGRWRAMLTEHRGRASWPLLLAGLLTAAAQFSIFYSYERARVSTASVLGATEPVWTLVAATLLMRKQEAPNWRLALSVLIIVGGSALVVGSG